MKYTPIALATFGLLLLTSWMPEQGGQLPPKPNIVLIVLDDVGVETIGCYNPQVPTPPTPRLTQLAQNGVKFTRVYSTPMCSPTRATILTGRYAFRTGMGHLSSWIGDDNSADFTLPQSEVTIPEVLKAVEPPYTPYTCGAFGKWHVSKSTSEDWPEGPGLLVHPIRQGFDFFAGSIENNGSHFNWDLWVADANGSTKTHIGPPVVPATEAYFDASVVRDRASTWIASVQEPFFAYVCFNPPHKPWQVPPTTLISSPTAPYQAGDNLTGTANQRLAYDWTLEAIDTEIGRLIDLMPAGKRTRTTFIVVADNGTPHEVIDTTHVAAPGPLFYDLTHAKGTVYEQGVNVPMIASGNKVNTGGQTCTGLVSTVDVWRTVIALASLPVPPGVVVDGKSFKPMLANPAAASSQLHAFSQQYQPNGSYLPGSYQEVCDEFPTALAAVTPSHQRALTDGRYKYIRRLNVLPGQFWQEAYDLQTNPLEKNTGVPPLVELWSYWGWSQLVDECDLIPLVNPLDPAQVAIQTLRTALIDLSGS